MVGKILSDNLYREMITKQISEVIDYLVENEIEFSITANVSMTQFNPELPNVIYSKLGSFAMFVLANYTFESIILSERTIVFEAGFGKENFGSVVSVPYSAIFQIVVDESILYLNPTSTVAVQDEETTINKSKNVFKNNPKNKKLFD